MQKETLKKFGKPMALLATIGALLTTTGCATHYVNSKGEVIATSNNTEGVARIMEATGNLLYGAGAAASAAADIVHAAKGGHHHHGYYIRRHATPVVFAPVVVQWCR